MVGCSFASWELSLPHVDITPFNNQCVPSRVKAKKPQALPQRHCREKSIIPSHHDLKLLLSHWLSLRQKKLLSLLSEEVINNEVAEEVASMTI